MKKHECGGGKATVYWGNCDKVKTSTIYALVLKKFKAFPAMAY